MTIIEQNSKDFQENKTPRTIYLSLFLLTLIMPFAFLLYGLKKCLNKEFLDFYRVEEIALTRLHTYSNVLNVFLGVLLIFIFNMFNPFYVLISSSILIYLNEIFAFISAKRRSYNFVVFYSVFSGGFMSILHNTKNTCVTCLFMRQKNGNNTAFLFSLITFTNSIFVLFFSFFYPYLSSNKGWSFYKIYYSTIILTAISPALASVVFSTGIKKTTQKTINWIESKRKLLKTLECSESRWAWIIAGVFGEYAYSAYGTRRMNLVRKFVPEKRLFIISGCVDLFRIVSPLFAWKFLGTKEKQQFWFFTYFFLVLIFFGISILQLLLSFFQEFWTTLFLQLLYGFSSSIFGNAFYPQFYYVFIKEYIGSGFGIYMSINSVFNILLNFLMELTYVKGKEHLYMLFFLSSIAMCGLMLAFYKKLDNYF